MKTLKALIVEDSESDEELMLRQLAKADYDVQSIRVQTAADMKKALAKREWDIILSDYRMPGFTGLDALRVLKESGRDIPLIIISGTMGEDAAVEAMRSGVNDYLIKGNLTRLAPAIDRELETSAMRRAQKQAEKALHESEERFRSIVETTSEWIWAFDSQGNCSYSNPALETILGYAPEEIIGKSFLPLMHEEEREKIQQLIPTLIAENRGWTNLVLRWYHKDGSIRYLESNALPLLDSGGEVIGYRGSDRDITKSRRIEEEKRLLTAQIENQHERLNNIVADVPGVVWEAWGKPDEAAQKTDFISDYVETMLGYTVEEWLTTSNFWISIVHPEDKERITRIATENFLKSQNYTAEFRWIAKDGRIVWVKTLSTVICDKAGQPIGLRGINIDITERKRLEDERTILIAELDFEKARLQHIFDNSPSFIVSLRGPEFVFEIANPAYYQLVGHRNLIGISASEALPEIMTQGLSEIIRQVYNTGEPFIGNEVSVKLQPQDGSELQQHYINFVYLPMREADNSVSGIVSYGVDVTEQVLSRAKIQESEERYRFLFDNNPLPMWAFDLETLAFLAINDAAIKHYGYSREEFLTMTVKDIRPPEDMPAFLQNIATDIPGIMNAGVVRHIKKDGTVIDVEITTNQLVFNGKKAKLVLANDVTERRKAEESVRFQAHLLNTVEQAVIATDLDGIVTYWNQFAEKLYGWTKAEAIGRTSRELTAQEMNLELADRIIARLSAGKSWAGEFIVQNKAGVHFPAYVSNSPVNDDKGKIVGFVGVSVDITERKRAEEALEQSERDYYTVFEQAHDAILIFAPECEIVLNVNQRACELYGFSRSEFVGMSIETISKIPANGKEKVKDILDVGGPLNFETVQYRKDGSEMFLEVNTSTIIYQGQQAIITINRDITERKRAEHLILESEERYRNIVETANEGILLNDIEGRTIFVNRQMPEMLGYRAGEMLGQTIFDFIFEEDLAVTQQRIERRKQGKTETSEIRLRRKDGSEIICLQKSNPTRNEAGEITGFLTMNTDITERKKAERELQYAEAKYRSLVESSPAIVYLAEPYPPYSTLYVSPNIVKFGYSAEEWFNRNDLWMSLIHPEDRDRVLRITETSRRQGLDTNLEYRIIASDGTIHWLQDRGRFVSDEQGNRTGWQGVMLDITETKGLEEQLRQSQKLESVGRLAGGIAHDFNNMLTAINGYSELTLRKLEADNPLRQNIEEIKKAGERSAQLTHQLLAFSRQQVLKPVVLNLNEVITDTIKLLERLIGEDIKLVIGLNPKTGRVNVDPGQLSQIIMNLAVNARDAMPQGGRLTIETANVFLDPNDVRQKIGVLPGAYVMLAVCDTGDGIDENIQGHIFEPFFTTKEIGKGTGLGLATVYGIVKQSSGNIEVESKKGIGTTFRVYLPRVVEQTTVEAENPFVESSAASETIILVEDEELVRNLSREILESSGYTVIEARDGLEALEICKNGECKFDLLMTDVVMPQMGGRELAEKLIEKMPNIKILFTSGYTDDAVVRNGVLETHTNFLQKPFTFEGLTRKVRELLDE